MYNPQVWNMSYYLIEGGQDMNTYSIETDRLSANKSHKLSCVRLHSSRAYLSVLQTASVERQYRTGGCQGTYSH